MDQVNTRADSSFHLISPEITRSTPGLDLSNIAQPTLNDTIVTEAPNLGNLHPKPQRQMAKARRRLPNLGPSKSRSLFDFLKQYSKSQLDSIGSENDLLNQAFVDNPLGKLTETNTSLRGLLQGNETTLNKSIIVKPQTQHQTTNVVLPY